MVNNALFTHWKEKTTDYLWFFSVSKYLFPVFKPLFFSRLKKTVVGNIYQKTAYANEYLRSESS